MFLQISAVVGEITPERVNRLPEAERTAWAAYLEKSRVTALADQAALQAELSTHGMTQALRAPSGGDFKQSAKTGDAWHAGEEARVLADIVLSYQTPAGGWSKHTGYTKGLRKPGMQWSSQSEPGAKPHYLGTFDNRSTTEQMQFLANMWLATQRDDCKEGFIKGLNYVLAAQYPNGGWPQVYPLEGSYHDDITLNDDALTHVLELLQRIVANDPSCAFLDELARDKVRRALGAGIDCVLAMQVVQDGRKTAWCAQHDALTLQPTAARKMEPATLSGVESANLLRFLMTLPNPAPKLVAAIEAGLAWFDRVKIPGLAPGRKDDKSADSSGASSDQFHWARFYGLTDSKPVFPGRDGVLYTSFNEMAANNKLGYDFFSTKPGSILKNGQKNWRKMLAASQ
ncbi:MAG: pectate lyase, partial [Akkermansiaceae bacterium]